MARVILAEGMVAVLVVVEWRRWCWKGDVDKRGVGGACSGGDRERRVCLWDDGEGRAPGVDGAKMVVVAGKVIKVCERGGGLQRLAGQGQGAII